MAQDRYLREVSGNLERFPPIKFTAPERLPKDRLNPFLVILNAEVQFRRYRRQAPHEMPLPADVLLLMKKTAELVEAIYWEPEIPDTGGWRAGSRTHHHKRDASQLEEDAADDPRRHQATHPTKAIRFLDTPRTPNGAYMRVVVVTRPS